MMLKQGAELISIAFGLRVCLVRIFCNQCREWLDVATAALHCKQSDSLLNFV